MGFSRSHLGAAALLLLLHPNPDLADGGRRVKPELSGRIGPGQEVAGNGFRLPAPGLEEWEMRPGNGALAPGADEVSLRKYGRRSRRFYLIKVRVAWRPADGDWGKYLSVREKEIREAKDLFDNLLGNDAEISPRSGTSGSIDCLTFHEAPVKATNADEAIFIEKRGLVCRGEQGPGFEVDYTHEYAPGGRDPRFDAESDALFKGVEFKSPRSSRKPRSG